VAHRRGGKRNRGIGVNLHKCHVGSFLSTFCIVPSPQRAPPSPLLPPPFRVSPLSQPLLSHRPFPGAPHLCAPLPPCPRVPCPHMTTLPVCWTSPSLDPPSPPTTALFSWKGCLHVPSLARSPPLFHPPPRFAPPAPCWCTPTAPFTHSV